MRFAAAVHLSLCSGGASNRFTREIGPFREPLASQSGEGGLCGKEITRGEI